jgi:acyl carrier protein
MSQPVTSVAPVVRELCTYLAGKSRAQLTPDQLDPAGNVWLAGYVDSLSYVEFLVHIQERYGVEVSDVDLTGPLNSIQALASFICGGSKPCQE